MKVFGKFLALEYAMPNWGQPDQMAWSDQAHILFKDSKSWPKFTDCLKTYIWKRGFRDCHFLSPITILALGVVQKPIINNNTNTHKYISHADEMQENRKTTTNRKTINKYAVNDLNSSPTFYIL